MSNQNEIERGDVIAIKDGKTLRVLSIYKNGKEVMRVEGVDDAAESPKRISVLPADIIRILRKAAKPVESEVRI